MQIAKTYLELIRERGKQRIATGTGVQTTVQQRPLPDGLREDLSEQRGNDPWRHR